jgi:hypothetical protein
MIALFFESKHKYQLIRALIVYNNKVDSKSNLYDLGKRPHCMKKDK